MHNRRRGDRRNRLLAILFLLGGFYVGLFVWPTAWRYDRVGNTPIRTNRVSGEVEYLNLQGWQPVLPPLDVRPASETSERKESRAERTGGVGAGTSPAASAAVR